MLNEALRLIRVYHDMRQSEAAEKLGISNSYLSEIEKGKKKPSLEIVEKYSAVFKIPMSSILFFSESLDGPPSLKSTKRLIASKIIDLMKFLETRSDRAHAD